MIGRSCRDRENEREGGREGGRERVREQGRERESTKEAQECLEILEKGSKDHGVLKTSNFSCIPLPGSSRIAVCSPGSRRYCSWKT